jgi:hypothetical protein
MLVCRRRHSGEDGAEEDDSKKSKRHRNDKDRSSDKRDDDDRYCTALHSCNHSTSLPRHLVMLAAVIDAQPVV